jgi:hypothetical protein
MGYSTVDDDDGGDRILCFCSLSLSLSLMMDESQAPGRHTVVLKGDEGEMFYLKGETCLT